MDEEPPQVPVQLRLYVHGGRAESRGVEQHLREVFESVGLAYEVEVLDVTSHPARAEEDRILLTPTLIRLTPQELRVAGELSDVDAALDGLGLRVWAQRTADDEPTSA